jgi:serine/threonine protein kinase
MRVRSRSGSMRHRRCRDRDPIRRHVLIRHPTRFIAVHDEPNVSTPLIEIPDAIAQTGSENCLPVGARVAEFEITGIVGEGGFGIVYLAFDHSLQRVVALKEYMPGVMAGRGADQSVVVRSKRHQEAFDTGLRSFINEARLLAQFDHPALIKIHRFWEQNNTGYMAMRFYEGHTLKRIVQEQPERIDETWLKVILQSILEALEALYRVKILHRDISPENIMIQKDGAAVLLDFGAARQIIGDMTQALTVILKPGYAPIEQYADDPSMLQGPWTDIYSLSAVMHGAITGKTPPSSVARMIQDPLLPLAGGNHPGYDKQFLTAIDRGLAVRPEDRPRSIPAFRALLGLAGDAPAAVPISAPISAPIAAPIATPIAAPDELPLDPGTRPMPRQAEAPPAVNTKPPGSAAPATPASLASAASPANPTAPARSAADEVRPVDRPRSNPPAKQSSKQPSKQLSKQPSKQSSSTQPMRRAGPVPTRAVLAVIAVLMAGAAVAYLAIEPAALPAVESAHATAPVPAVAKPEQLVDDETLTWERLKQRPDTTAEQVDRFIAQYPNGRLIDEARARLAALQVAEAARTGSPASGGAGNAASGSPAPAPAAASLPSTAQPGAGAQAAVPVLQATVASPAASAEPIAGIAEKPVAAPTLAAVGLSIKPWGNVIVDGVERGVSPPLRKLMLADGKHSIRITNPGFPDHVSEIDVGKKKPARVVVDFVQK